MWRLCSFLLLATLSACTIQSSLSNRYLSAEKLWTEKNYAAAVLEFDRIVKESPNTSLGLQSLWRASMTRTLFLNQQEDALKGLLSFIERASSSELVPQVQREIGDIYFSKLNQYSKAIEYYQKLLTAKKFSDEDRAQTTCTVSSRSWPRKRPRSAKPRDGQPRRRGATRRPRRNSLPPRESWRRSARSWGA